MQEICPLCLKNGVKSKTKAFQINLEEAVWACERKDCIWPIGYQKLMFCQRPAVSCNWEEFNMIREYIPESMELSLYTPPVTPRGETIEQLINLATDDKPTEALSTSSGSVNSCVIKETLDYDKQYEMESNLSEINDTNIHRKLPSVSSIVKINDDLTITFQDIGNLEDKKKINLFGDTSAIDTTKKLNVLFDNTVHNESSLNIPCENKNWQNKCDVQLSNTTNSSDTDLKTDLQSNNIKSESNVDITNTVSSPNSSMINNITSEITNMNCSSIDTILEHILNNENSITNDINDDWLDMLQV